MPTTGLLNRLTRASNLATLAFRNGWSGTEWIQPNGDATYLKRVESSII